MKIILVVNTFGSFLSHRRGLYLEAIKSHDVKVIFPISEDCSTLRQEIPEDRLIFLPLSRKGTNPLEELKTIFSLYRVYLKEKPDLAHHFTIKPVIYGTLAARLAKIPRIVNSITGLGFVFTALTLKARILSFIVKNLYRLCFASQKVKIIFQNSDDREFFINTGIIASNRGSLVPGSGVDIHRFQPTEVANTPPRIFVASRILVEKGFYELMEAFRILHQRRISYQAWIAGDPDPANPGSISLAQIEKWKSENLAVFLGHQKDMVDLLKQVDIACLPSYREGLPMSLLEAMACGKPIITTDAPGCRETVSEGINGFLVPVKDGQALAKALETLLTNDELRRKMGLASREIVEKKFSREIINEQILNIYKS